MSFKPEIKVVHGPEIKQYIPSLAWLRVTVFHEFPYLYDGSDSYERAYLKTYLRSDESIFVLVFDENKIIGASSGIPLKKETEEVIKPFLTHNIKPDQVYYFGESVLLKQYRGHGVGKIFFKEREAYAISKGYNITAFCGVVRPENHPRKPKGYRTLHAFWEKLGYSKKEGMLTEFDWQDLDENETSPKQMQFWLKHHNID
ncbi:MAG: GNAT family N-acetyltransferase [Balneolales bacterium]|nr:GNAT family N-acetyltransferase [Balneolales bacterium]